MSRRAWADTASSQSQSGASLLMKTLSKMSLTIYFKRRHRVIRELVLGAGIPLIMETPVQEPEPAINYKKSLLAGEVVYRHEGDAAKIGTDKRDIALLYSLCK